jgi:hypothetical protein
MKTKIKTNFVLLLLSVSVAFTSCTKEPGCMDPNSMTYNSDAKKDDGSCVYAYEIAQGMWSIDPVCDEISVLGQTISIDDQLPDSIDVQGAENNILFIDIDGTVVSGEIDNDGNITVENQTVSLDLGLGLPIDVDVEGSGLVNLDNTGEMQLTYSFEIPLVGSQSINCDIILHK